MWAMDGKQELYLEWPYMPGTTTKPSIYVVSSSGVVVKLDYIFFSGLGLTVTDQKGTETRLKKASEM